MVANTRDNPRVNAVSRNKEVHENSVDTRKYILFVL